MKSGDYSEPHDDAYHREEYARIVDPQFVCRTFRSRPALIRKGLVNGHREIKDYHGEPYNAEVFDLVEGVWDHEHCSVCYFTILDGQTYWENRGRITLLCDACHEAFMRTRRDSSP